MSAPLEAPAMSNRTRTTPGTEVNTIAAVVEIAPRIAPIAMANIRSAVSGNFVAAIRPRKIPIQYTEIPIPDSLENLPVVSRRCGSHAVRLDWWMA